MARISAFAIGRRWRCERAHSISFDFVITGPGPTNKSKVCRLEALPGQENKIGHGGWTMTSDEIKSGVISNSYDHSHLRKCAVLQPLGLDDLARAISD